MSINPAFYLQNTFKITIYVLFDIFVFVKLTELIFTSKFPTLTIFIDARHIS